MGRISQYETDVEERLPMSVVRLYDAAEETYTYRDTADGGTWEIVVAPGNSRDPARRIAAPLDSVVIIRDSSSGGDNDDEPPPPYSPPETAPPAISWRAEMAPLFNFFLIVGLFLMALFWYLHVAAGRARHAAAAGPASCGPSGEAHAVRLGDSCWSIAQASGLSWNALVDNNKGIDCAHLVLGQAVCVPRAAA